MTRAHRRAIARVRPGAHTDIARLVHLINLAYEAERFFVRGDRTTEREVRREMEAGAFLVAVDGHDQPVGCVHVRADGDAGTFGMLAVDPARQGQGLGRRLIEAAEGYVLDRGGRRMEILVVNLREDLLRLYRQLGYAATDVKPYVHRPTTQPCHFVVMQKPLVPPRVS
jgi:GNAT superfamily N-acetyltransferase